MSRDALFDLAVNRAADAAARLGALRPGGPPPDPLELRRALEVWYLKTRFAYRVPLEGVVDALRAWPGPGTAWEGGREGGWREGRPERP